MTRIALLAVSVLALLVPAQLGTSADGGVGSGANGPTASSHVARVGHIPLFAHGSTAAALALFGDRTTGDWSSSKPRRFGDTTRPSSISPTLHLLVHTSCRGMS